VATVVMVEDMDVVAVGVEMVEERALKFCGECDG